MITTIGKHSLQIRPITENELGAVLDVYRQCEDFLSLGPVSTASMEMVLKDLEISKDEGGVFCGIYEPDGRMIGIIDYVPNHYLGNPHSAFLSLLMIGAPHRGQGVGREVVDAVEAEIRRDARITMIVSGVQVNNPMAIEFWQRMGYRIVSGPKSYPDQTTAFDLRKDLIAVEMLSASIDEKPILRNLLELCQHDYSEYDQVDVDEHGLYGYRWLDHYWTDPGRYPFLVRVDGKLAGFVLVRDLDPENAEPTHSIAEFFVMRKYRRMGIGRQIARWVFDRFPGKWSICQEEGNLPAQRFWRQVINEYTHGNFMDENLQTEEWRGPCQTFSIPGTGGTNASLS